MNTKPLGSVRVNGTSEPLAATTISALLGEKEISVDSRGVAVAVNGSVVPRARWSYTALNPGDRIEIVRVLQGG